MSNEKTGLFEGDNLLNQIVNITKAGAYDVLVEHVKELQAENEKLKKKEIRVYVWEARAGHDLHPNESSDEEIISYCEKTGKVYSLEFFEEQCNNEELDLSNSFIRII